MSEKTLQTKQRKTWCPCSVGIWYDDVCQGFHHNKKTKGNNSSSAICDMWEKKLLF